MKICKDCSRLNLDEVEKCAGCGCEEFDDLHFATETNDIEPYLKEKDKDNGQVSS